MDASDVGLDRVEDPANLRARVGFRVPQVQVAGSTAIENEDDGFGLAGARPDGWGAYFYLGRAKLQSNDAIAAVALLEKASELNPDDSSVLYQLSRAFKAAGRDADARKASARVAELKRQGVNRDQGAVILP